MNLKPTFEKLYPENSIGGECGVFAHKLVDLPLVGDSYAAKKKAVDRYGVKTRSFRPGDVIITNEGTFLGMGYGHVAVVNFVNDVNIWLTESNFKKNKRVTHTRVLPRNSSKIYGVMRGNFKFTLPYAFPLRLKTVVVMNQPLWPSLINRMARLQDWFYQKSGYRIWLEFQNPIQTNLSNWPYVVYPDVFEAKAIKPEWYTQYIQSLAGDAKIMVFVVANKDWDGAAAGSRQLQAYRDPAVEIPIRTVVVADENEMSGVFPSEDAFFDYARHEIMHGLYINGHPNGFDFTHRRFYDENNPEACFGDFDYNLLALNLT